MARCPLIVLTGGPGGGKTTLIEELSRDAGWRERVAALPEAIWTLRHANISPQDRLFQRAMVYVQMGLEEGLQTALAKARPRAILCHRGTLDPLAYWLQRGWSEDEFFVFTQTARETLLGRYAAVIHLVTAADGAAEHYARYPAAHRPETPAQAIELDRLLQHAWQEHPHYYRFDNAGQDWMAKSAAVRQQLERIIGSLL